MGKFLVLLLLILIPEAFAYELSVAVNTSDGLTTYNASQTIEYKVLVKNDEGSSTTDIVYIFAHWVEDANRSEVKGRQESEKTLKRQKTESFQWTPQQPGTYSICGSIAGIVNETNQEDNEHCMSVIIEGEAEVDNGGDEEQSEEEKKEQAAVTQSTLEIGDIRSATFGQMIFVELIGTKADTQKYAITLSAKTTQGQKVSEETKMHVRTKQTEFVFLVPIQLKQLCKPSETYIVEAEGLGVRTTKEIRIEANEELCEENEKEGERLPIDIVIPKSVRVNEPFTAYVIIHTGENNSSYSAYSYGNKGKTILTAGYDGTEWKKTWTANKQTIKPFQETTVIELRSRFEESGKGATYTVVVKNGKTHEIARSIDVIPKENLPEPTKEESATAAPKEKVTGRIIYAKEKENIFKKMKKIFKNLLN